MFIAHTLQYIGTIQYNNHRDVQVLIARNTVIAVTVTCTVSLRAEARQSRRVDLLISHSACQTIHSYFNIRDTVPSINETRVRDHAQTPRFEILYCDIWRPKLPSACSIGHVHMQLTHEWEI